jgi:hypothetical protein
LEEKIATVVATKPLPARKIVAQLNKQYAMNLTYETRIKTTLSGLVKRGVLRKVEGGYIAES